MLENPTSDEFLECLKEEGQNNNLQILLTYFSGFTKGSRKEANFIFSDGKLLKPKNCIKEAFKTYKKIQCMQIFDCYNLYHTDQ